MSHNLEIETFHFNAQTDYLPYYKKSNMSIDNKATAKDLLLAIAKQDEEFDFPEEKTFFRINGLVVDANQPISEVVERLGNELKIDPVFTYRSTNDLVINDEDFMQSYELLSPYASEDDLEYYKGLYAVHYASETLQFVHDYIGDAILLLAHKMITEGNPHKKEILQAISDPETGLFACEYDNNLFKEHDYTDIIESLKKMAKGNDDEFPVESLSFVEKIKARLGIGKEDKEKQQVKNKSHHDPVVDRFEELLAAYYPGDHRENEKKMRALIEEKSAGLVRFEREYKRCGLYILEDNPRLAFRKAGAILLDAYDNAAEVLVIEDPKAYEMMSNNLKKIEDAVGREIGLELTTSAAILEKYGTALA